MSLKSSFQILLNFESRHEPSKQLREKKRKVASFKTKRKRKEIWIPLLEPGGKAAHRGQTRCRSPLTLRHRGAFLPAASKKKEAHLPKAVSQKLIHPVLHPYLNSSVHFAQFSADLDNIPNMTRS